MNKVRVLSYSILIGLAISIIFNYIICGFILKLPYPWNTPFFIGLNCHFSDLWSPILWFRDGLNFNIGNYFPVANVILWIFSFLPLFLSLFIYLLVSFLIFFLISSYEFKGLDITKVEFFLITFLSFPFLFLIDRANIEIFVYFFVWLFYYFFRKKRYFISSLLLALAVGMKLYPLVFLLLFIKRKKYQVAFFTLLLSVVFIFILPNIFIYAKQFTNTKKSVGKVSVKPSIAKTSVKNSTKKSNYLNKFQSQIKYYISGFEFSRNPYYFADNKKMQEGVSIFNTMKLILIEIDGYNLLSISTSKFKLFYLIGSFVIMLLLAIYMLLIEDVEWKCFLLLSSAIILLPFISCSYKLIYLFIPLYGFLKSKADKSSLFFLICFILLLIPKKFYVFPNIITSAEARDITTLQLFELFVNAKFKLTLIFQEIRKYPIKLFPGVGIDTILNPLLLIIITFKIIKDGIYEKFKNKQLIRTVKENLFNYLRINSK